MTQTTNETFHNDWTVSVRKTIDYDYEHSETEWTSFKELDRAWAFLKKKLVELFGKEQGGIAFTKMKEDYTRSIYCPPHEHAFYESKNGNMLFWISVSQIDRPLRHPTLEKTFKTLEELRDYIDSHVNGVVRDIYKSDIQPMAVRALLKRVKGYCENKPNGKISKVVFTSYGYNNTSIYVFYTENRIKYKRVYDGGNSRVEVLKY